MMMMDFIYENLFKSTRGHSKAELKAYRVKTEYRN